MLKWFETLYLYEQILWIVSIVFSFIFFYQIASTVIKRKPDKSRAFIFSRFLSFKNIAPFFAMFGWVSISGLYQNFTLSTSLILGVLNGAILMAVMSVLFYYVQKAKESAKPEERKMVTTTGNVISTIGKKRSSSGKINIKIDGIQKTMDALTDFEHDITTGTKVRVESVTPNGVLIIKPLQ